MIMARRITIVLLLTLVSFVSIPAGPRKIIFDTDWWTDVDDACAIRILLDADRRGEVDLLGICMSAVTGTSATSLDSYLRHEGCPDIPLGADKDATDYTGRPSYHQTVIDCCADRGARNLDDCEDCVDFYRRLLAGAGGKVDIIAVGYPNALAKLLESGPDGYSRLSGVKLVRRKVRHLWMMAGNYPEGKENNFTRTGRSKKAGALVCGTWPTGITFLGYEVGVRVKAGGKLLEDDVLHKALAAHGSASGRFAWDPMTTLMAISGNPVEEGYAVVTGTNVVDPASGANVFTPSPEGRHRYVVMDREPDWFAARLDSLLAR